MSSLFLKDSTHSTSYCIPSTISPSHLSTDKWGFPSVPGLTLSQWSSNFSSSKSHLISYLFFENSVFYLGLKGRRCQELEFAFYLLKQTLWAAVCGGRACSHNWCQKLTWNRFSQENRDPWKSESFRSFLEGILIQVFVLPCCLVFGCGFPCRALYRLRESWKGMIVKRYSFKPVGQPNFHWRIIWAPELILHAIYYSFLPFYWCILTPRKVHFQRTMASFCTTLSLCSFYYFCLIDPFSDLSSVISH